MRIHLENGITLVANYFPRSCLPLLDITDSLVRRNFWAEAFTYNNPTTDAVGQQGIFGLSNLNLSASQKETLLWHYRLSHASIPWIQLLMQDHQWLKSNISSHVRHQGPFAPYKYPRTETCDLSGVHCAACLTEKAHVCTPGVSEPKSWPPVQVSSNEWIVFIGRKP